MAGNTKHAHSVALSRLPGNRSSRFVPYLIPGILGLAIIVIIPFVWNIYLSLTRWRGVGPVRFIGLQNWQRLFKDSTFWISFLNSFWIIVAIVVIPTILGLFISSLLTDVIQKKFGGKTASFLRALFYLPQLLPVAVAAIIMGWIFRPEDGAVNALLEQIGLGSLTHNWLGSPDSALPVLMFILVWIQLGYPIVIFMSGLQRVDPELYEAASLDGANWWQKFRVVTLPSIIPELLVVILTATIGALKTFAPVYLLTKGGPGTATTVPSYYSYNQFFQVQQVGYGAAISTALTVVIIVSPWCSPSSRSASKRTWSDSKDTTPLHTPKNTESHFSEIEDRTMTQTMTAATAKRASHKTQHVRSAGDWVTLVLLVVAALIVLFPLLVLTVNAFKTQVDYNAAGPLSLPKTFTMEGIVSFWTTTKFSMKFLNSLIISLTVAVAAVVLSVLNSFALGIGRVKGNTWIVLAIMLANMMPQEALLYPLYTMFKAAGLYNTKLAIIIIFTIIQSAYGTYLLSSVYGTFPQAILEAASIDGASRWQVLLKVVLPISWPTISVLFVFFFVWTWNEYMIPMAFLMGDDVQTIPLALATLQGQHTMEATTLASASLLSIIPTIIFFVIFQRKLSQGITAGAVK